MRISDWSSDVCSSDLRTVLPGAAVEHGADQAWIETTEKSHRVTCRFAQMAQMARMCVASAQLLFAAQRRENFLRGRHIARGVYAQPMCGTVPCAVGTVDAGFTAKKGGVHRDAFSLPGDKNSAA